MTPSAPVSLGRWMWLAALLLMVAEFVLFDTMTSRYYTHLYPRWNDQVQYLTDAYHAADELHDHGLFSAVKFTFEKKVAQGTLHDTAAVVVFWLAGSASRSAVLSLNMLVFLAWQAALLFTLTRATGSRTPGWMAFGLVLCLAYPWSGTAGSTVDFRLDHAAMCLFGISACAMLLSSGFRATGWSLVFGVTAGLTLLERFLTGAYFAPIFVVAGLWALCQPDRWMRLRNLLLAAAIVTVMAGPIFWRSRADILDYYWVGQVTGEESAARLLGFNAWQSIRFTLGNFGGLHLGVWFGWVAAGLTALLGGLAWGSRRGPVAPAPVGWLLTGLAFFLVPGLILTLHRQKSEVVLGILAPGALLLLFWLWQRCWQRIEFSGRAGWPRLLPALPAVLALGAGAGFFVRSELRPAYSPYFGTSAERANWAAEYIYRVSRASGLQHPNVGIDRIADFLDGRILSVMCYERHREWIDFGVHLPASILAGEDASVMYQLRFCDFMILTDEATDFGYWPYDKQMRRLYPELKAWCDAHLRAIGVISAFDREMVLYQRRELRDFP